MEKDIGKIKKNDITDIVVRIDDFGGKTGLTIREFATSDRYTGFTKSGTRISAENFAEFKQMINSIDESELKGDTPEKPSLPVEKEQKKLDENTSDEKPTEKTPSEEETKEEVF
jgi:hypothetical protein